MAEAENPTQAHVNRIALKIPPFWADEPELWFAQLESQFTLGKITQDSTKYAYVLSHIETRHAKEIKDVITNPPTLEKYSYIKKTLIQRLSASQEQQIKQLLEHEEMGDRRPSQFLRHLQALAGPTIPEQLLRTLWMGRLPAQLQAILAARSADNLEIVAEQADKVYEVTGRTVAATSTSSGTPDQSLEQQVRELTKQVASLTNHFSRLEKRKNDRNRQRSKSRNKREAKNNICFYHNRFKEKAQRCIQPCEYKKPVEN